MAASQEQPTGFSGLDAFVTHIDSALEKADDLSRVEVETAEPVQEQYVQAPVHRDWGVLGGLGRGLASFAGIGLSIAAVVAIKACAGAALSGTDSSVSSGQTDYSSSTTYSPDDTWSSTDSSNPNYQGGASSEPTDSTAADDAASDEDLYASGESEPSPSELGGRYSAAEIRYCLSQDIRISGAEKYMNELQITDPSDFNVKVDQFNGLVSDWNSRCSRYSYLPATMASVQADVEANRASLEQEGRSSLQ
jgi:hypothetical protein